MKATTVECPDEGFGIPWNRTRTTKSRRRYETKLSQKKDVVLVRAGFAVRRVSEGRKAR
jgi:hypothetical protein